MGTWDGAGKPNLFFAARPRRWAAALMAAFFAFVFALGSALFYSILSWSDWATHLDISLDIFGLIFVGVYVLIAGYMLVMYLVWAVGRAPMLTLDREALRFRPAPWYERAVRWEDVARVEVRAIATRGIGLSRLTHYLTLRVLPRPEARGRYWHRRWLTFRLYEFLLPISVADLAATIEDFASVERRAFWL